MTTMPTHFEDRHKLKLRESAEVVYPESVDIITILRAMSQDETLKESFVKTDKFEIRIKR